MSNVIKINDFDAKELDVYARLSEGQLLNRHEPEKGIFIAGIIVVSSELPEAMGISDRMIIMSEGRITAELTNKVDFVEDSILDLAIGGN